MLLLALAIAPGIAICLYIFFKDQYNREPRRHLIISFFLGFVSAGISLLIEWLAEPVLSGWLSPGVLFTFLLAFLVVALTEEWSKYIMVRYYAFPKPEFDEPFDGIVYAVMVGMGFATLENTGYVMQHGMTTAIVRMFLSVPAHGTFAILMGYYTGLAWSNPHKRSLYLMQGLFLAVLFHGTFDFFLFLQTNEEVTRDISELLLFLGAAISFILAVRLSRKAIRSHIAVSKRMHENKTA